MQDMSIIMAMDRTTLTRNLSPLVKMGLVKVSVGSDRRSRPITVTLKGKSALEKALPYWQEAQSHIVDTVGSEQWDAMMRGLHQISLIVEES